MIRVCFHYRVVDRPWGGANNFLRVLQRALAGVPDVRIVSNGEPYDVLLLNQLYRGPGRHWWERKFISRREIVGVQRRGRRVVCRTVNLQQHISGRPTRVDENLLEALESTDCDVFQSAYSLRVFRDAGYRKEGYSVIPNGVDARVFQMNGRQYWNGASPLRILSCAKATGGRKRLHDVVRIAELPHVEVYHAGDWPIGMDPGHVHLLGVLRHDQLAQLCRDRAHILFHPAEKENCSNAVLEALSCGLPVLYYAGDGTAELAGDAGVAMNDHEDLANGVDRIRQEYGRCVAALRQDPDRFSIDRVATRYGDVFRRVLDRDLSLVRS